MESAVAPHRPWLWPALAGAGVAAICLGRCTAGYLDPVLCGEDWAILFARYFWDHSPGLVFEPYAGYLSLGPQLIGWFAAFLPAVAQPHALAFAAGIVAALALGWFAAPRFAHLLPDARLRALVCLLLALYPIADAPLLCTTMYAHWHMLFVVCLAALAAPPSPRARWVELGVVTLCAWSHPVALLVAPLFAWRAWRGSDPMTRRHYACLALSTVAYLGVGVDWQARTGASAPGVPMAILTLLGTVVLPSFTLNEDLLALIDEYGIPAALVCVPFGALFFASLHNPRLRAARPAALALVGLAMVIAVATVASRWASQRQLVFTSPRYAYVPALLLALWAVTALLNLAGARVRLAALLLLAHAVSLNTGAGVAQRFRFAPRSDGRVVRFAAELEGWAQSPGIPGESRRLVLPGRVLELRRPAVAPPR